MRRPSGIQVWLGVVIAMIVALLLGGGLWMATTIDSLQVQARARQASLDVLMGQYADLYRDSQAAGVDTTAPDPVNAAEPPPGDRGLPGVAGLNGADGRPGRDGINGLAGLDGLAGLSGTNGADGATGAPSTVAGPAGADGADGAAGAPGAPGRGIAALDCVADGAGSTYWVVTYTDGATAAITGPCRVGG